MKKNSIDKEVIERIRGVLDKAANAEYSTMEMPKQRTSHWWVVARWAAAVLIMAISLSAYWTLQKPVVTPPQVNIYSVENLVTHEPQAWQEDPGLIENIEFYTWLSLRDAESGAESR